MVRCKVTLRFFKGIAWHLGKSAHDGTVNMNLKRAAS